jgi:hypothetical protein
MYKLRMENLRIFERKSMAYMVLGRGPVSMNFKGPGHRERQSLNRGNAGQTFWNPHESRGVLISYTHFKLNTAAIPLLGAMAEPN